MLGTSVQQVSNPLKGGWAGGHNQFYSLLRGDAKPGMPFLIFSKKVCGEGLP